MHTTRLVGSSGLLIATLTLGACTEHNGVYASGYCDDQGCYSCLGDQCGPIANASCDGDQACKPDQLCTSIGCATPCGNGATICGQEESCVDGFCAPFGFGRVVPMPTKLTCAGDDQCSIEQYCSEGGSCTPKCQSDEECGPDQQCIACGKCQPKEAPATCGSSVLYCSDQVSCGEGKTCHANRCHFECKVGEPDQCPVGQVCGDAGRCADDPAPASAECALDVQCDNGICINGYCHARCKSSEDCPGLGAVCLMGACQPDYNPVR